MFPGGVQAGVAKKITILTAIYGAYDALKPLPAQDYPDVDAICVTDDSGASGGGWRLVVEPRPGIHPNLAAKRPKMLPWAYTDADIAIWVDASYRVTSPGLAAWLADYPFAQYPHPARDCLFAEAAYSAGMPKYAGLPLAAQTDHYRAAGHPPGWGLWATGIIVRHRTDLIEAFGATWLAECERWGYQDQVSHPYALRTSGLRPAPLPGSHLQGPHLNYEGSQHH